MLLALSVTGPLHAALHVEVADVLTPAERAASERLVADVLNQLPATLREQHDLQLRLRWRDDLPAHVQGRARGRDLGLDRRLLPPLLAATDASHTDVAWQQAHAALIHELAHALDRSPQGGWSRQARFLDLAGWQQRPLWPGRGRNQFALRSPDRYELHSPAEFFAVNLEHYLLDAEYRCRRPALHAWFTQRLGQASPGTDTTCDATLPFMQAGEQDGLADLLELDPARIYEVDFLLAEGNAQLMSRWGHSMLRLVICAPGRLPGPACRMDLQHHLVLSFRAFVGDVQLSSWRGLTGSYPSRLFVLPLSRVVEEYTRVELRGLSSTPLALSRQEIDQLLVQAARLHWSYDGRYFFVSNNCAVETWKLLHEGVSRLDAASLSSITPTGLLRRLREQAIASAEPTDRQQAIAKGYYFESAATHYALVFDVARKALPLPSADVEAWLKLPAGQRRPWMEQADDEVLAAMLLLEQAAWRRQELLARDVLKRHLLSGKGLANALEQFNGLMARADVLLAPGNLPAPGYGIPIAQERIALQAQVAGGAPEAEVQWQALRERALALLPVAQRQQMEGIEANLGYLRQRLRLRYGVDSAEPVLSAAGDRENMIGYEANGSKPH
ncbi:DUF4105 domain-containing protein [Stenotrophomonas sp. Iso1]|uniref:DUF7844 domain-containing protein n=1 Tax=Stenotrophomonas sp. Iso1 TaxID=2977283 RepID=UPI0022B7C078|nr:DUF4105 domain-containing protein [Stenotrophomonas sp. Iso1]